MLFNSLYERVSTPADYIAFSHGENVSTPAEYIAFSHGENVSTPAEYIAFPQGEKLYAKLRKKGLKLRKMPLEISCN